MLKSPKDIRPARLIYLDRAHPSPTGSDRRLGRCERAWSWEISVWNATWLKFLFIVTNPAKTEKKRPEILPFGTNFSVLPKGCHFGFQEGEDQVFSPPEKKHDSNFSILSGTLESWGFAVIDPSFRFQSRTPKLVHKVVYYPRKSLSTRSREGLCHWDMTANSPTVAW